MPQAKKYSALYDVYIGSYLRSTVTHADLAQQCYDTISTQSTLINWIIMDIGNGFVRESYHREIIFGTK